MKLWDCLKEQLICRHNPEDIYTVGYILYRNKKGSSFYVVHEAADEKVHGTCVQDLSSSRGKELNAAESFTRMLFRRH
jgi:hypothetical protein